MHRTDACASVRANARARKRTRTHTHTHTHTQAQAHTHAHAHANDELAGRPRGADAGGVSPGGTPPGVWRTKKKTSDTLLPRQGLVSGPT